MFRYLFATVTGAAMLIWFMIGLLSDLSVQKAVSRDAVDKALHWGSYMSTHIPDIQPLVETGAPTPAQIEAIRHLRALGDVFRFKLFDAQGRLVLISDESFMSNPAGIARQSDAEPQTVLRTGEGIVDVFNGEDKPDRPDLYAEAYIPLVDQNGSIFGVAEVYVDETQTRQYFRDSFERFGLYVSTVSALLFLIPAIGFGVQRKLAMSSRKEADYLAKFDSLTGVLNRTEFSRRAEVLIAQGRLKALLFLDGDKFKAINDTHGHAAGDIYLEQIGRNLTASTNAGDLVARFGGDEFVVAICDTHHDTVIQRVRSILALCAAPVQVAERTITGSVSIGVSFLAADTTLEQATAQADAALYYAKSAGRNQYALYGEDMGKDIRRRNALEACIRDATENNTFTLDYQPLVAGTDQRIIGYEALMRLKSEDGTQIPPAEFIPVAEELGLIDEMGQWAIFQATRDIARLPGSPKVAINMSAAQFRSGRLPELVADALAASGLSPDRLELEITESLLLDDNPDVAFQIDALQELGVTIAMDDFGTGFSSLGYLWKFGFDRLKIDRSFVAGLSDNPERSLEIIESVVLLGKRLGMQVTAEGVETPQQMELLSNLGCDVLQGFHFGYPGPLEDGTVDDQGNIKPGMIVTDQRSTA